MKQQMILNNKVIFECTAKVERDEFGHLTHYTIKVVKDMKVVDDHAEVNNG